MQEAAIHLLFLTNNISLDLNGLLKCFSVHVDRSEVTRINFLKIQFRDQIKAFLISFQVLVILHLILIGENLWTQKVFRAREILNLNAKFREI